MNQSKKDWQARVFREVCIKVLYLLVLLDKIHGYSARLKAQC